MENEKKAPDISADKALLHNIQRAIGRCAFIYKYLPGDELKLTGN